MKTSRRLYGMLGRELMGELAAAASGEIQTGGLRATYQTLKLDNGVTVRFTPWRKGTMPFYIVLFDKNHGILFELDLSMLVRIKQKFFWHLKIPSHPSNIASLRKMLGEPVPFSGTYSDAVGQAKSEIDSGINTPRRGFHFIDNEDWEGVCSRFLELMQNAINAHTTQGTTFHLKQAKDDDPNSQIYGKAKIRRNQAKFRINLKTLYGCKCAISGEETEQTLEAAHIDQHSTSGVNHTDNGVLLRADLHRLFDANLIGINPIDHRIEVAPELKDTAYAKFAGKPLRQRLDKTHPHERYLKQKWLYFSNKEE